MSQSANLILPYLAPGQAQKHVTVNESLRRLDAVVQLAVVSATIDAQPGSPADGAVWILPPGKTGAAWGAMANHALAYYRDGAWEQVSPREGWLAYVKDADGFVYFDGSAWEELAAGGGGGGGGDYTDEMARDAIAAALTAGTGLSKTVDDSGDTITLAIDTSAEAERIRDVIAVALVAGSNVSITPDDGADTITIAASGGGGSSDAADVDFDPTGLALLTATNVQDVLEQIDAAIDALPGGGGDYTDEQARDAIGAALVAGAGINIAVNDSADTITISATGGGGGRELLSAARTYYVRSDGSDSNNGLSDSSGGAFATIQKALEVAKALDFGGHAVTIQLGDATYTGALTAPTTTGQALTGDLVIKGNASTPGNTIISTTSANCITAGPAARIHVQDVELRTTTAGNCLHAAGGVITFSNVRFGASAGRHMHAEAAGVIEAAGNYARVGACTYHASVASGGLISVSGRTVTASGTPSHTVYAYAAENGVVRMSSNTYSGASTGTRWSAVTGGGVQTEGGNPNNLPGNSNGSATSPGWSA